MSEILQCFILSIINLFIKRDKKSICFLSGNMDYDYNSKYLFEFIINQNKDYKCKYIINDNKKRNKLNRDIGPYFIECKTFSQKVNILKCSAIVSSAGLPFKIIGLNYKRVVLNVWHGMPLKKINQEELNGNILKKIIDKKYWKLYSMIYLSIKK